MRRTGTGWRIAAILAAVGALALSSVFTGGGTASAADVSASLGVGCSASSRNGVADVKLNLTVKANGNGGDIDSIELTNDDGTGPVVVFSRDDASVGGSLPSTQVQVDVPDVTDSYTLVLTVEGEDGSTATKTAQANVTVNGSRVSCSVRTPAP